MPASAAHLATVTVVVPPSLKRRLEALRLSPDEAMWRVIERHLPPVPAPGAPRGIVNISGPGAHPARGVRVPRVDQARTARAVPSGGGA